jgi:anaerobic selenocysteine-containing dehydrogenase
MREITQKVPPYAAMNYPDLAYVEDQFPDVGGDDLYYGGTAYTNRGGLGIMWPTAAENGKSKLAVRPAKADAPKKMDGLKVVPIRLLYDRGPLFEPSELMHQRIPAPYAELNSQDAARLGVADGDRIAITAGEHRVEVAARVNGHAPAGIVLLPLHLTKSPVPTMPVSCSIQKIEE